MSRAASPSGNQFYDVARICAVWGVARATVYWAGARFLETADCG